MTKGIRDLRQIQIGFQYDADGGACEHQCDPLARLVGQCGMKRLVNRIFPTEATGIMSDHIVNRYYDPWVMAELPISMGDEGVTFQQLPWYLAMGAVGGILPTPLPPTVLTWEFCPDLVAGDMPDVATIRYGDNAGVWEATCCFARQLVLSAAFQGAWALDADIIGRDMKQSAFIPDLPYPTPLNTILGQMTSWYLEGDCTDIWNTPDPTPSAKVGYLIDWRVTIPGFHPKFFQDGELYYTTMGLASRHLTFEATVEFDSDFTKAILWDGWVDGTPLYTRIRALGGVIPGDTLTNYRADIDMVIMLESCETLDQRDGNDIIKFVARTAADIECDTHPCSGDAGFEWGITVVNGVDDELPACAGPPV